SGIAEEDGIGGISGGANLAVQPRLAPSLVRERAGSEAHEPGLEPDADLRPVRMVVGWHRPPPSPETGPVPRGMPETLELSDRFRAVAGPLILLLIVTGFFWKLLTKQYTWLDQPDLAYQVMPWLQFQAASWHRGEAPLWDPHEWAGQPLPGQLQPGAAYPL